MTPSQTVDIGTLRSHESQAAETLFQTIVRASTYYNEWAKKTELDRYSAAKLAEMAASEPESVVVARAGGELAGFCFSHNDSLGLVWLDWVGVAESCRRRGLARTLVRHLIEAAPARGAHKIWCDTRVGNAAAATIFEKLGFERICELRNHWYGLDYYLWQRSL
jgi:ribosomal protein S18 acetylase RimI-like enzyme